MKSFLDLAKERYSARSFSERDVEQEHIDYILEAAKCAPTAKNVQPQHLYLVKSKENIEKLGKVTPCLYGAKYAFIVCSDGSEWTNVPSGHRTGEMDASIVCTHMMLAAADRGIGTCWVCNFDPAKLKQEFELPEETNVWCLLPFGYVTDDCGPSERHTLRKPLEETVEII